MTEHRMGELEGQKSKLLVRVARGACSLLGGGHVSEIARRVVVGGTRLPAIFSRGGKRVTTANSDDDSFPSLSVSPAVKTSECSVRRFSTCSTREVIRQGIPLQNARAPHSLRIAIHAGIDRGHCMHRSATRPRAASSAAASPQVWRASSCPVSSPPLPVMYGMSPLSNHPARALTSFPCLLTSSWIFLSSASICSGVRSP